MTEHLSLDSFRLLGRSGLRISPLCLGTMTFGAPWGADDTVSQRIFDTYVDAGGNNIDTADYYSAGHSESLIGKFAAGKRDRLVLATKYSLATTTGDPNAGGNHRKNMMRSVEASLKRLGTDYIDLFYLHVWDGLTPVEEIMRGLDDLVRSGKVVYVGISDTPAWQVSRMQMLASLRGWAPFIGMQVEYNLLERSVERDLIPMAAALGIGVLPWSPLAGGLLSGKYSKGAAGEEGGRSAALIASGKVDDRVHRVVDVVKTVAQRIGRTPSEVALAWTLANPAVACPVIGARTVEQLEQNLRALDVELGADDLAELDNASAIPPGFPYELYKAPHIMHALTAGTSVPARS